MSHRITQAPGTHALAMQTEVLGWFAAGHDVLWIPIVEVSVQPDAIAQAQAESEVLGKPYLLHSIKDFARIPNGVRGWVFPAHQDDTYTVALRQGDEVSLGTLCHPVTGERIRDKIAASKAKGMWMGGPLPLGYDVRDRLLVINETEAALVRRIFDDFVTVRLKSP